MASPPILDFDALLAPIEGEQPTGANLRKDFSPNAIYRAIKDARTAARRAEERGLWEEPEKRERVDWSFVLDRAPKVLSQQSKDLEIAAWLTEALVRSKGFAGARDGFRLCRELVVRYWDSLHPNPEPDEPAEEAALVRVAALAGLNGDDASGTLIDPLLGVSVVDAGMGAMGAAVWEHANRLEQNSDPQERERQLRNGVVPLATFQKGVADTSAEFYQKLVDDLLEAQKEFQSLCEELEQRCGAAAPPSSNIRQALQDCHNCIQSVAGHKLVGSAASATLGEPSGGSRTMATIDGPISTRDQAFAVIQLAADYFRRTEPHSVLSWQLECCLKWGRMTAPELLMELIPDSSVLEAVYKRVGIPPPPNG